MENRITIKQWKMNWDFLIKNYLNPEMWEKTWTLFQYKEFVITLNIYCIYTRSESIAFDVRCHYVSSNGFTTYKEETISCSLKIEDLTFLKRQINSAIFKTIVDMEKDKFIRNSDEYQHLLDLKRNERERLSDIAERFLDDNDVTNENIREAYIDAYVSEYEKIADILNSYVDENIYRHCTDFYLIWLDTLKDDPKKKIRTEEIHKKLGNEKYDEVMAEIKEYEEYMQTEEFVNDAKSNLIDL